MINVNKQIFLFNSFSVSFCSLCHWVDFFSYIFSFGKTENFDVYAAERLRQRGKNETKSNVNKKMSIYYAWKKVGVKLLRAEQKSGNSKLKTLISHLWEVCQKKWSISLKCHLMKRAI